MSSLIRANSADPDQTAPQEQSDLGLQSLQILSAYFGGIFLFFLFFFLIQFNVPFNIISLIQTSQLILGGAKQEYALKTT